MSRADLVLIGRNEGARLVAALQSVRGLARQIVYVDSGSSDDSIAQARAVGAKVVELDMSLPFTAARARNAGFDALEDPQYVMFMDGDCMIEPDFLPRALAHLQGNPHLGLVTGWRSEIHRDASLYNQLCDWEWHRPAGMIMACGGDMLVRAQAWAQAGGMNPRIIAAEDDEFCTRLRKAGWQLERLPLPMTRHDAAMLRFGQWWSRAVRTGHGFAQVGQLHRDYFVTERRRVLVYGLVLPVLALVGLMSAWPLMLCVLVVYIMNFIRTAQGLHREGLPQREAWRHSRLLTLSKLPNFLGLAQYHLRRISGSDMRIIEYK